MSVARRGHACSTIMVGKQKHVMVVGGVEGPKWRGGAYHTEMLRMRMGSNGWFPNDANGKKVIGGGREKSSFRATNLQTNPPQTRLALKKIDFLNVLAWLA